MNLQREMGNKWSIIKKHLPGTSENDVKNRYHCIRSRIHTRLKTQLRQIDRQSEVCQKRPYSVPVFLSASPFVTTNYSMPVNSFQGYVPNSKIQQMPASLPASDSSSNSILPLSRIEIEPMTMGSVPQTTDVFLGEDAASYPHDMNRLNSSELFDCQTYDNPDSVILDDYYYTGNLPVYNSDSVLSML